MTNNNLKQENRREREREVSLTRTVDLINPIKLITLRLLSGGVFLL